MDKCQKEQWRGKCCCNCQYHLQDFHHCTTVKEPQLSQLRDETGSFCVCGIQKGWICASPEIERAHSGWTEHGLCEMHYLIETVQL